jgi:hypothetical protein
MVFGPLSVAAAFLFATPPTLVSIVHQLNKDDEWYVLGGGGSIGVIGQRQMLKNVDFTMLRI